MSQVLASPASGTAFDADLRHFAGAPATEAAITTRPIGVKPTLTLPFPFALPSPIGLSASSFAASSASDWAMPIARERATKKREQELLRRLRAAASARAVAIVGAAAAPLHPSKLRGVMGAQASARGVKANQDAGVSPRPARTAVPRGLARRPRGG